MMTHVTKARLVATVTASIAGVSPSLAYKGENLAQGAKISISQPRTIALKAHPEKITDEELEREKGGSGLRYSFDVKRGSVTQEVGVDAKSGRVLENKKRAASRLSQLHPVSNSYLESHTLSFPRQQGRRAGRNVADTGH